MYFIQAIIRWFHPLIHVIFIERIVFYISNLNKTVIVIAHRLQTVKHADEIIVLENWEIKERWTHKELISKKGVYKKNVRFTKLILKFIKTSNVKLVFLF